MLDNFYRQTLSFTPNKGKIPLERNGLKEWKTKENVNREDLGKDQNEQENGKTTKDVALKFLKIDNYIREAKNQVRCARKKNCRSDGCSLLFQQ